MEGSEPGVGNVPAGDPQYDVDRQRESGPRRDEPWEERQAVRIFRYHGGMGVDRQSRAGAAVPTDIRADGVPAGDRRHEVDKKIPDVREGETPGRGAYR